MASVNFRFICLFFFSFFSTLAFYLYVEYLKCNVMLYIIILQHYVHPLYLHKYQRLKYIFIKFQLHFDSPESFMFSFITKPEMTRKLFQIQDIIKENRKLFVFQLIVPYFFFKALLSYLTVVNVISWYIAFTISMFSLSVKLKDY